MSSHIGALHIFPNDENKLFWCHSKLNDESTGSQKKHLKALLTVFILHKDIWQRQAFNKAQIKLAFSMTGTAEPRLCSLHHTHILYDKKKCSIISQMDHRLGYLFWKTCTVASCSAPLQCCHAVIFYLNRPEFEIRVYPTSQAKRSEEYTMK